MTPTDEITTGRASFTAERALLLTDEPLTGIFSTSPSAYIRSSLGRFLTGWAWIPLAAITVCLVMAMADHDGMRWIFAGVILAFCVYPLVMLHVCLRSMVKSGARLCVAPKRILINDSGLVIVYQKIVETPQDPIPEHDSESIGAVSDKKNSDKNESSPVQSATMIDDDYELIPFSAIWRVTPGKRVYTLNLIHTAARSLIIPSDSFLSADCAVRLMSAVGRNDYSKE